ncbi:MAG: DUF1127 domain-containing protein [Pseudomonadota bacterium]
MANITFASISATLDSEQGFFATLRKRIADYRMYRRTFAELDNLSDTELNDLGLSRYDLERSAYESVYGRR